MTLDEFGHLPCEACAFDFHPLYGDLAKTSCDHLKPLSSLTPGQKTRLVDLSLACSNCHRMLTGEGRGRK